MHRLLSTIISLFTILIYTALGTYILTRNPHERSNKIFALIMLVFMIWAFATYNLGLVADSAPLSEIVMYVKIQLSGVILALTFLVFLALSLSREKALENPLVYIPIIPSLYVLYLVWSSDIAPLEPNILTQKEFFFFSAIFGIAGIYLLLWHYTASKYRQREQAKILLIGAIVSILVAVTINILLPMFFGAYYLALSTLAPAVMGIFFAYAVYRYGLFVQPMPEISFTSFCGVDCLTCPEFVEKRCMSCKLESGKYKDCEIYTCVVEKGYSGCIDCPEVLTCIKRREKPSREVCLGTRACMEAGTCFVEGEGYEMFINDVKKGALGIVATTAQPQQVREKYDLKTTPILWISDEAFDNGVKPDKLGRLSIMLVNFMEKVEKGNAVVLLDGINTLVQINGFDKVHNFLTVLSNAAKVTESRLIISDVEESSMLRQESL